MHDKKHRLRLLAVTEQSYKAFKQLEQQELSLPLLTIIMIA